MLQLIIPTFIPITINMCELNLIIMYFKHITFELIAVQFGFQIIFDVKIINE